MEVGRGSETWKIQGEWGQLRDQKLEVKKLGSLASCVTSAGLLGLSVQHLQSEVTPDLSDCGLSPPTGLG